MREIIEDKFGKFEVIEIDDNISILQYLKGRNRAF